MTTGGGTAAETGDCNEGPKPVVEPKLAATAQGAETLVVTDGDWWRHVQQGSDGDSSSVGLKLERNVLSL